MRLPELLCDSDSSATARRNNVHSVGFPDAVRVNWCRCDLFLVEVGRTSV